MKKALASVLMLSLFLIIGCKKSDENKSSEQMAPQQNQPAGNFRPQGKKKKRETLPVPNLELYNESNMVTTIPQEQYNALSVQKIKIKDRDANAIPLKDLLTKY